MIKVATPDWMGMTKVAQLVVVLSAATSGKQSQLTPRPPATSRPPPHAPAQGLGGRAPAVYHPRVPNGLVEEHAIQRITSEHRSAGGSSGLLKSAVRTALPPAELLRANRTRQS